MLKNGGFPPVWKQLYSDPSLRRQFPYLPVLEQAIDSAQPRPVSADYDQASLVDLQRGAGGAAACGRHPSRRWRRWRPSWPRSSSEKRNSSPT